jgi:hypothetical protein
VFEASWIKLLCKAGLSYRRARKLTGKLAAVIRDERVKVSRVRHDREALIIQVPLNRPFPIPCPRG